MDWYLVAPEFIHNRFASLFGDLATLMTTRPTHIEGTISYERYPSPKSDLSTESNEDQDEEPSRLAFSGIINPIILHKSFQPIKTKHYVYVIRQYAPGCFFFSMSDGS